jgi:hypothetical protein
MLVEQGLNARSHDRVIVIGKPYSGNARDARRETDEGGVKNTSKAYILSQTRAHTHTHTHIYLRSAQDFLRRR